MWLFIATLLLMGGSKSNNFITTVRKFERKHAEVCQSGFWAGKGSLASCFHQLLLLMCLFLWNLIVFFVIHYCLLEFFASSTLFLCDNYICNVIFMLPATVV